MPSAHVIPPGEMIKCMQCFDNFYIEMLSCSVIIGNPYTILNNTQQILSNTKWYHNMQNKNVYNKLYYSHNFVYFNLKPMPHDSWRCPKIQNNTKQISNKLGINWYHLVSPIHQVSSPIWYMHHHGTVAIWHWQFGACLASSFKTKML